MNATSWLFATWVVIFDRSRYHLFLEQFYYLMLLQQIDEKCMFFIIL